MLLSLLAGRTVYLPMTPNTQHPEKLAIINIGRVPTHRMESAIVRLSTKRLENDLRLGCLKYKQTMVSKLLQDLLHFILFFNEFMKVSNP